MEIGHYGRIDKVIQAVSDTQEETGYLLTGKDIGEADEYC